MQLSGAGYDALSQTTQNPSSLYEAVQKMRMADASLRQEAAQIQARANADGQTVTTQLSYGSGPDGRSYVTSITVTRTQKETLGERFGQASPDANKQPLQQAMQDISPARLPFTPSDMTEGFAASMEEMMRDVSEGLATRELQNADVSVRNHEGLHFRTAGGLAAGLPVLDYMQGPDGQYYAVAGEVRVQTGATSDPEKASRDASTYARAAIAPGDASAQDMFAARSAFANAAGTYSKALAARSTPLPEYNMTA